MNDTNKTAIAYRATEVEKIIGTSSSNFRKWCLALENGGYTFVRGSNNSRLFYNQDVVVLMRLKDLIQGSGMTVDGAVNTVVSMVETEGRAESVHETNSLEEQLANAFSNRSDIKIIKEKLEAQEQFNKLLLERLEQQQTLMNQQLKSRDEHLMSAIRAIGDSHKKISASIESPKEEKKGFFARLFGK